MKRNLKTKEGENLVEVLDLQDGEYFKYLYEDAFDMFRCECVFQALTIDWNKPRPTYRDAKVITSFCEYHDEIKNDFFNFDTVVYKVKKP